MARTALTDDRYRIGGERGDPGQPRPPATEGSAVAMSPIRSPVPIGPAQDSRLLGAVVALKYAAAHLKSA
jgi:hypothetical protein